MNRNYDFKFGINNVGSSSDVCSEDYRGKHAFSEPETTAIKDFVEQKKDLISMAFNFHAYGNLLIYPFNYDPSPSNNELYKKFPDHALFYEEITQETHLPPGNIRGNAMQAI